MSRMKKTLMFALASAADDKGITTRYYQHDAAAELAVTPRTIRRTFRGLLRPPEGAPGPFLERLGNGRYQILGVATHDPTTCGHVECLAEHQVVPEFAGETRDDRRRRQAAARAREFRARQRRARETG